MFPFKIKRRQKLTGRKKCVFYSNATLRIQDAWVSLPLPNMDPAKETDWKRLLAFRDIQFKGILQNPTVQIC